MSEIFEELVAARIFVGSSPGLASLLNYDSKATVKLLLDSFFNICTKISSRRFIGI